MLYIVYTLFPLSKQTLIENNLFNVLINKAFKSNIKNLVIKFKNLPPLFRISYME